MELPDRIPKERYYDPEFYAMENELFWPRVWQMACRLEEIPNPGDFAEYEDPRPVGRRRATRGMEVKAYDTVCRHRGVKLVDGNGKCKSGFTCSFHGWCYGLDGENTYLYQPEGSPTTTGSPPSWLLAPVRCELFAGCTWIDLDDDAPPLRDGWSRSTPSSRVEGGVLRTEWWQACRLPVNWKVAMAAFMEGYHVPQTHPQLREKNPSRAVGCVHRPLTAPLVDMNMLSMRELSVGMAGMTHANDVRIAEGLHGVELPDDPALAAATGDARSTTPS